MDDKGTVLIAAFGVPPLSHADDPLRAVEAALKVCKPISSKSCGLIAFLPLKDKRAFVSSAYSIFHGNHYGYGFLWLCG